MPKTSARSRRKELGWSRSKRVCEETPVMVDRQAPQCDEEGWVQRRMYDVGLSDEKKCRGLDKEDGTEKPRLCHCPSWRRVRDQIPEGLRKMGTEGRNVEGGLEMARRHYVLLEPQVQVSLRLPLVQQIVCQSCRWTNRAGGRSLSTSHRAAHGSDQELGSGPNLAEHQVPQEVGQLEQSARDLKQIPDFCSVTGSSVSMFLCRR